MSTKECIENMIYTGCPIVLSSKFEDNLMLHSGFFFITYRMEVIEIFNLDGSARPKRSPGTAIFTSGKSSKCNGRLHAFGSVSSSETRSTTSEVEF